MLYTISYFLLLEPQTSTPLKRSYDKTLSNVESPVQSHEPFQPTFEHDEDSGSMQVNEDKNSDDNASFQDRYKAIKQSFCFNLYQCLPIKFCLSVYL